MRVEWRAASPWLWWVIGGVAVIAAGALIWGLARRRRGEAVPY